MTSSASSAAHRPGQSLSGKTVLITGAASALGACLARILGECGASVVGVDIQAARLADGMAVLRERGIDARAASADISDRAQRRAQSPKRRRSAAGAISW